MNAVFNILKPPGMSSGAVVGAMRRITGERRCGHGGTLDPQASGVLPICVGKYTRLFDYFADTGKQYVAEIYFGLATDTQDVWGEVVARDDACVITKEMIADVLPRFLGTGEQIPPMYSAIKQGGKKLYELARAGKEVERKARIVHINSLDLLAQTGENRFLIDVLCSKGTYIRTLCLDIGQALGCPAAMSFLLRSRSGVFSQAQAVTLEEVEQAAQAGCLDEVATPIEQVLGHIPAIVAQSDYSKQLENGVSVPVNGVQPGLKQVFLNARLHGLGEVSGKDGGEHLLKMKLLL